MKNGYRHFTSYLEHEGLTSVIEDRKKKGISDKTANEKYSKHVKTLLQVDAKLTDDYSTELNYPIEFIPLKNPYALSVGDKASFKLMYLGKPLTNKTVQISSRNKSGNIDKEEIHTKTNNKGVISFKISNGGHWYVSTIHLIESNEEGLDYESNWATLTFEVK